MHALAIAVGLSLLGTLGGVLAASLLLVARPHVRTALIPWLVSYAVGTLLGAALLALLPEALSALEPAPVMGALLGGVLTFFVLEKLVVWRHCHTGDCTVHDTAAWLILLGDALHNFVDGAIIGAAVLSSVPLGVSTAVAVAAHEIPQEIGDIAILLAAGYSRRRALGLNALSGGAGVLGTLALFTMSSELPALLPYVLPVAAGGLLYVAMADLIPDLHRNGHDTGGFRQLLLIAAGILTIVAL